MKKKLIIGLILLVSVGSLALCNFIKETNSYSKIIELNWGIRLSGSYKEIYSIDSGASFHGDGERYHIFEYNPKEDIINALEWRYDENKCIEQSISEILERLNVPDEYSPGFKYKYQYYFKEKKSSTICILLNDDEGLMYVIEHFQ